jgi:nitrogen regulatory protein P-II 1
LQTRTPAFLTGVFLFEGIILWRCSDLKKLEFIIKPERLEDVKEVLNDLDIKGMTVMMVSGCGTQKGKQETYRGVTYNINLLPKIKVETVVKDELADELAEKIMERLRTGNIGDGKIFIYDVEGAIRIRTGERNDNAI